ncbi:MAG: tyrosine-type recombinase/integrase [Lachnospiraceae bacterium]|nr:tyrosine-type recombinase/integrase [Lachnospiraceae bacterium]
MGKDSEFNKQKDLNYRYKLKGLKQELPGYTYEFLDEKAQRNPNTAVSYAYDLRTFLIYLQEFCPAAKEYDTKDIPLEILNNLSFQDINEYQKYLSAKDIDIVGKNNLQNDISGIARRMSALRTFYKYLCEHDYITNDATAGAIRQRRNSDDHVITRLTADEVDLLLNRVKNGNLGDKHQQKMRQNTRYRDYAVLTLLLRTGIRVSECVSLDINDFNFEEKSMRVVRKGKKEQMLYFDEQTKEALLDYIDFERPSYTDSDDEPALFLSSRKRRLSVRSIQDMVSKYSEATLINKKVSPHKMRSTYGTALYNKTGDIRLVADVLGHKDINTTAKHYANIEEEHRRIAATINPYG